MRTLFSTLLWVLAIHFSIAQTPNIIITEIMYNSPESGTDSLEFIELYNNEDTAVIVTGYTFSSGVQFTFPADTLQAGEYVLIAVDSIAFFNNFGVTAFEWSGALTNGGEGIALRDSSGNVVDTLTFDEMAPWPNRASGLGASIVLCDADADNTDPDNWQASTQLTEVFVNGLTLRASPGAADSCMVRPAGYPTYLIPVVTTVDTVGIPDSLDLKVETQGIVYGANLRTSGLEFALIDVAGNGIRVFNANEDFDYTPTEGDGVGVRGTINVFNGLTQIIVDTVWRISQLNTLVDPTIVTALSEDTESELITIENVTLVNPAQWTNAGAGFNVDVTNGTDTFQLRVDAETNVFGMAAPTDTFDLTGIGGQFDSEAPFLDGYQIQPRYIEDIDPYVPAGEPDYPRYDIGDITNNTATGQPDSLGVNVEIQGVVYGVNIRGANNGLQFTIIDDNGDGITVFSTSETYDYTVMEGDEIIVRGEIAFFNGLTEIVPDTLWEVSENNTLIDPILVDSLGEFTESQLVRINGLTLVNPAQWTNSGSGFNIDVTNGTDTFQIRIDADVNIFGQPAPTGTFDLIGIGSQFDNSSPYTSGYQIFPRYQEDILIVSSVIDPTLAEGVKLYPNPVVDILTFENPNGFDRVRITNMLGQQLLEFKKVNTKAQFDVSRLAPGTYTLTLVRNDRVWATTFVKQ